MTWTTLETSNHLPQDLDLRTDALEAKTEDASVLKLKYEVLKQSDKEKLADKEKLKQVQKFMDDMNEFISKNVKWHGPSWSADFTKWDVKIHMESAIGDSGNLNSLSFTKKGKLILSYNFFVDSLYQDSGLERPVNMDVAVDGKAAYYNGNFEKEESWYLKWIYNHYEVFQSATKYLKEMQELLKKSSK